MYYRALYRFYQKKLLHLYSAFSIFCMFLLPSTNVFSISSFIVFIVFCISLIFLKVITQKFNNLEPFFYEFSLKLQMDPIKQGILYLLSLVLIVFPRNSLCTKGSTNESDESGSPVGDALKDSLKAAAVPTIGDVATSGMESLNRSSIANKDRQNDSICANYKTAQEAKSTAVGLKSNALEGGNEKAIALASQNLDETTVIAADARKRMIGAIEADTSVLPDLKKIKEGVEEALNNINEDSITNAASQSA